ncbi:MAG: HAD family phosphatase [Candidatus Aminicenantes bacterium]|nr:HAD family phosphatase [Candidatus Aminicenantes bacterium]
MIEAIVSDLGNVLLRFDNSVFYRAISRIAGRPEADIEAAVGRNLDLLTLFEKGAVSPIDFYRNAGDILEITAGYEEFFAAYCEGVFTPVPSVLDLFRRLKRRYRMILLSNTDVIRWTHIKTKFPEVLLFDDYVLSFDVGAMKPQLEIYLEAIRAGGAAPERTVFIDDMPANVAGAERAGMKGILCESGADPEPKLRALGVDF